jgi:hypothetical protein
MSTKRNTLRLSSGLSGQNTPHNASKRTLRDPDNKALERKWEQHHREFGRNYVASVEAQYGKEYDNKRSKQPWTASGTSARERTGQYYRVGLVIGEATAHLERDLYKDIDLLDILGLPPTTEITIF